MTIALIGGGPSALFGYKRLIDSGQFFEVAIYEKTGSLGCGMPYSRSGSADEHITNVSGNEIPALSSDVADWIKTVPKDTLDKYHIDSDKFNDYKVLPRLLFGQYLCDQFKILLKKAKENGVETNIYYNTTVTDIQDQQNKVAIITETGENTYDRVIVCTGHLWLKNHEGEIPGWFDSPYPPEKIARQVNFPVAIRGASLTAIDAVRTLGRHNGSFEKDEKGKLSFKANTDSPDFKIVMHSRNGLLPAVRFHLEDTHLGKDTVLSQEKIRQIRKANDGFLSLDYVFEENFKKGIKEHDPACYAEIKDLSMEAFVDHMMAKRESQDPFDLLKAEYAEADRSIKRHRSVYWKESLAILSFAMNYPAKYFSAEDMLRLQKTLMPLISVVIAFVPQSSAETLMALHDAGRLELVAVKDTEEPEPNEKGGAVYAGQHYQFFVDCIGQPHIPFEDIPFEGLKKAGTPARLKFRDSKAGQALLNQDNKNITQDNNGDCYLKVPGLAINDRFQLLDGFNALNERVYVMAVPFIAGFNPDYSGLDFGEAASKPVLDGLLGTAIETD
ncbi:hypothetical protein G7092_02790 [Mucilaginibacter sp. HC2]|uniref:FAD/NAD(P)-binding protein n=1 Tax=Mucilaginibacter inviolabilis TaxID=2714892 RepID=UPI00140CDD66|nr:FAD/NAD(P)-binding protein [Mucilaginibacter inviolabilis]NHA02702.1 hypothetical protein [Mucilaginibacter inviolabilis]